MSTTAGLVRGCGKRQRGGIYAGCGLSPWGMPIEHFLIDPPQSVDGLGLTAIGVRLIERDGVTHVFDVVGSNSYPNVADFIEETRRFGLSRRLPKTLDFSRLTPDSRIVLVHKRAIIENCGEYYPATGLQCPKSNAEQLAHTVAAFFAGRMKQPPANMCAGLWWHDIDFDAEQRAATAPLMVAMPSFNYTAHSRPAGIEPAYELGIFMSLPIENLQVIRDPVAGTDEAAEALASHSSLPVVIEDE